MNAKIATTFGLALMLALGIFGTMLALGLLSPSGARADSPVTAVVQTPDKPGLASTYSITFTLKSPVTQGETITVVFDRSIGVPASITASSVVITTAQPTGGSSSNPTLVTVSKCSAGDVPNDGCTGSGDHIVTLTVGDPSPNENANNTMGAMGGHKISFSSAAGITNPKSAANAEAKSHWIVIVTSNDPVAEAPAAVNSVTTPRFLALDDSSDKIGKVVTVTGTGYTSGGTATVYLDGCPAGNVVNFIRDGTEPIIATSDANISSGSFTATFTVDNRFGTGTCNINAHDHLGNSVAHSADVDNDVTFTVTGALSANKTQVTRGEVITIKMRQFKAGLVTSITFGGEQADLSGFTTAQKTIGTTPADLGELDIDVTVPTSVPLGTQRLEVRTSSGQKLNLNIAIVGAPVTLNPSTAVPDQKITITGSGFTTGGTATVAAGANANAVDKACPAGIVIGDVVCWSSSHLATTLDDSGNFVLTFHIPDNAVLHTAGTYEIVVTDSSNRTGSAILTVPSRTLVLDVAESRRGSTISYSGVGFPAKATVSITYKISATSTLTVGTVTADEQGAYSGTFTVPTTALIPSTNEVVATGTGQGAGTTAIAVTVTSSHKVPGASITIDPTNTPSGESIGVTGTGFPGFSTVTAIKVGGVDAIPTPNPATDVNGNFTATVLVPALPVGTKAVVATAGGVSASAPITIEAAAAAAVVIAPPAVSEGPPTEVFSEVIAVDSGTQVWAFQGGVWLFYDASLPVDHPVNASGIQKVKVGDGVWLFNSTDADVTATILSRSLTLVPGWNLKGL